MAALHKTSSFSLLVLVAQAQVFMGQNQTSARSRSKAFFNMDLNDTMRHSQQDAISILSYDLRADFNIHGMSRNTIPGLRKTSTDLVPHLLMSSQFQPHSIDQP